MEPGRNFTMTWRKYWPVAGSTAVVMTAVILLLGNTWNRGPSPTDDPDAIRTQAIDTLDRKLFDLSRWRAELPGNPEFDRWLAGIRNDFRPFFSVLSAEFDSRLIFIIGEFDAHADDSGPLRDHSRRLALVSARGLLEEERHGLENGSARPDDFNSGSAKLMRLPLSMLTDGW